MSQPDQPPPDFGPSAALQAEFDKLTRGAGLAPNTLQNKLGDPARRLSESEQEKAFAALASILKDRAQLRDDMGVYLVHRTKLREELIKYLRQHRQGGLVQYVPRSSPRARL